MTMCLIARTGTLLIVVMLLGPTGTQAEEPSAPTTPGVQHCKVSIEGDRAFVPCHFTVDVGLHRVKFHLMYKSDANHSDLYVRSDYSIAFVCFWLVNGTGPACLGDPGYRLNSTHVSSVVVIEVPRRGAETKQFRCQIAGNTDVDLAQPCCFNTTAAVTTTPTPPSTITTKESPKSQPDSGMGIPAIVLTVVVVVQTIALISIAVQCYRNKGVCRHCDQSRNNRRPRLCCAQSSDVEQAEEVSLPTRRRELD